MTIALALALLTPTAHAAEAECVAASPGAVAEELRNVLAMGSNESAAQKVKTAEESFRCLRAFVSAEDLGNMYQLAGTAVYYSTRRDEADALFRRAATVAPTIAFDGRNLGADAATAYAAALVAISTGPMGSIQAIGPIVVDGTTIRTGSSVVLPVGTHLVQEGIDGGVRTTTLTIEAGATLRVGTPDPAVAAARRALLRRKRTTALVASAGLAAVSGGLVTAARVQEQGFLELDPEAVDDPVARARSAQLGANASLIGSVMAAVGALGFAWQGATLDMDHVQGDPP
jgi:hypothetical protein